jgi:predicted NUDIX family NTP pyrophosphohydrolase
VAVLVVFRTEGDPEKLLARHDETLADAISMAPARPEAHYCVAMESGMMIVDAWASRADLQRAIIENEDFQAKWRAVGWPEETVEVFELHKSGWPV